MTVETKKIKEYLPNVVALWDVFGTLMPPNPGSLVESYVWKGDQIMEKLHEVAKEVKLGEGVERRVLVPVNPGLKRMGLYTATHTIYVGFQIVMPGEEAGAHRHTPFASRFMIRGRASTTVDGTQVDFEEGDFVTTPRWAWHDHANHSDKPVIWLDALDLAIPKMFLTSFFEDYEQEVQTPMVGGDMRSRTRSTGLTPAFNLEWVRAQSSPLIFKWHDTYAMLSDLASFSDGSPYEGVAVTYRDPSSGKEISDTIGADISLLKGGVRTKPHRHTMSVVYFVVKGSGSLVIDGRESSWNKDDIIVLTPWASHSLVNDGKEEAILFSLNDRPLLKNSGLYREEPAKSGN